MTWRQYLDLEPRPAELQPEAGHAAAAGGAGAAGEAEAGAELRDPQQEELPHRGQARGRGALLQGHEEDAGADLAAMFDNPRLFIYTLLLWLPFRFLTSSKSNCLSNMADKSAQETAASLQHTRTLCPPASRPPAGTRGRDVDHQMSLFSMTW